MGRYKVFIASDAIELKPKSRAVDETRKLFFVTTVHFNCVTDRCFALLSYNQHSRHAVVSNRQSDHSMIDFIFQLLTLCCIAATPWFAAWIANGGKREGILIPILGSSCLASILMLLFVFFY